MKRMRQEAILAILGEKRVSSQGELVRELARRGFSVTQATVSRDLLELKVARVREEGGGVRYVREVGRKGVDERLRREELARVLRSYMISLESSGNLLVLRTDPGNAQPLALGLDRARLPELLGTVAGDDTVICVVREGAEVSRVVQDLRSLAEGKTGPTSVEKRRRERKESS